MTIARSVLCPHCQRWQLFWFGKLNRCRRCGKVLEEPK